MPAIRKLTEEGLQVRLAVSLHTPDDELRDTLVPVNTRWKVAEVIASPPEVALSKLLLRLDSSDLPTLRLGAANWSAAGW